MTQSNYPIVKIRETHENGRTWYYRPSRETLTKLAAASFENSTRVETELTGRAIFVRFGDSAFFHQDSGLPRGYGQIFRYLSAFGRTRYGSAATSVTGNVYIETIPGRWPLTLTLVSDPRFGEPTGLEDLDDIHKIMADCMPDYEDDPVDDDDIDDVRELVLAEPGSDRAVYIDSDGDRWELREFPNVKGARGRAFDAHYVR